MVTDVVLYKLSMFLCSNNASHCSNEAVIICLENQGYNLLFFIADNYNSEPISLVPSSGTIMGQLETKIHFAFQ